jgi:hypothetical protein
LSEAHANMILTTCILDVSLQQLCRYAKGAQDAYAVIDAQYGIHLWYVALDKEDM